MPRKKKIKVEIAAEGDTPTKTVEVSLSDFEFINSYMAYNMNGTQAYLALHTESSYDSARSSASDILAKPNVQEIINDRIKKNAMSADEVIARISAIARGTHHPFIKIGPDGFVYFDLSHPEASAHMYLVKEMETKRERKVVGFGEQAEEWEEEWVRVKLHDSHAALRDLGKFHRLFVERIESSNVSIQLDWDDLTPEQIVRLRNGVDPSIIKKEIDERKSATD